MPSETVIKLRNQLREQFPAAHRGEHRDPLVPLSTPQVREPQPDSEPFSFDTWHAHAAGTITEISPAHPACGLSLLVSALLASNEEDAPHPGLPLVLIDARDQFDPESFSEDDCRKILWLRCGETQQALKSADLLLRDGNLPLVLLDLSTLPPRELQRIPRSSWHRLRQLAESTQTSLVALTPSPFIPGATLRLTLTRSLGLSDLLFPRDHLRDALHTRTTRQSVKARTA